MSKKTDQTLKKCNDLIERLQELKKGLAVGGGDTFQAVNPAKTNSPGAVTHVQSNRKPANGLGVGWSQDGGTGAFHHSTHGIIQTSPHPEGGFQIKHGGRAIGRVPNMQEAGAKILGYVKTLGAGDTGMHSINPMTMASKSEADVEKSGYGPKGAGQYTPADNVRRKSNNVGGERFGNQSVKSYTGRATVQKEPKGPAGPVRQYTPAQIAAINEANKLKKNAEENPWVSHGSVPNADQEVNNLKKNNPVDVAENLMANQLANVMLGRSMLGTPPPKQPTDQEMFGHLAVTEEMEKSAQKQWEGNAFNSFLQEATKPISSRFASEEEELAYWNSIKVSDNPGGESGY
jgi:hypothetical protein